MDEVIKLFRLHLKKCKGKKKMLQKNEKEDIIEERSFPFEKDIYCFTNLLFYYIYHTLYEN